MRNMRDRSTMVQGTGGTGSSYVRILHTVPTVPPVDIYADGKLLAKNLSYGEHTDYYALTPGNITFTIYRAGSTDDLIGIVNMTLPDKSAFTISGIGVPDKLGILQVPETAIPTSPSTMPFLRFVNLSSDVPPLDVSVQNGSTIFQNVGYKDYSLYHRMKPGDYTLSFTSAASGLKLFNDLDVQLQPGTLYSVYTIGYNAVGKADGDVDGAKRGVILMPEGMYPKSPA